MTENYNREEIEVDLKAKEFVKNSLLYFKDNPLANIYNSDQSGFNLEIHSGCTLETKGVKRVEAICQSLSSITHSYTIQPTISVDGQLLSPLYVVLQQPKGIFGTQVQSKMKVPDNIFVQPSTSGKLTKTHLIDWFKEVYFKHTQDNTVLLLDSWTTYNDQVN